jgi:putative nucleotidyltransferase with HDIG domain
LNYLDIGLHNMADDKKGIHLLSLLRKVYFSKNVAAKFAIGLALTVILALLFPRGEAIELNYKVGAIWAQKDLIAPFSFPILRDEHEYTRDVEAAKASVLDVFERDTVEAESQLVRLNDFFRQLTDVVKLHVIYRRDVRKHLVTEAADSAAFASAAGALEIPFTDKEWDLLDGLAASGKLKEMGQYLAATLREYLRTGILDRNKNTLSHPEVAVRRGTNEQVIPLARLYDKSDIVSLLDEALRTQYKADNSAAGIAYKIGIMHVLPDIKFSRAATDQAITAAADQVPRTIGFVQENERIVSKHERITPDIKLRLDSLRRAKAERGPEASTPSQLFGTMLHVTLVVMLFGIYLFHFRKRIFTNNRRLTLIALLILLEGLFAYLTRELDINAPLEYLIFVPVASMLLTIVFDSRVGFYGTVIIAFIVGGIRGNDYSIALVSLVAGALSVYSVRDMKNRTQIFRSLGFIFLGYGLSIVALGLERFESMPVTLEQLSFALVNAVVSPVLTYGLLIFLERVFKVTTDLALLELAHFNHPLLRMLALQAPGTYHHSMSMASLAEAAASAVGANEVLARVGAYFHDIGKIEKPTYFVENQKGTRNKHDKLSPRMSSLIIAAHVKEGIALAREYHLPEEVVEFIPMHHGTTRMDFFYQKALQLAQSSPDETKIDEIKEQDYRYPGPKPQTKETGIMMLADAVEAAVRTLEEPTPQRLEAAIDELIKKRFEEGELDECPLTLKDLTKIKEAFLSVLVGVYHSRVRYPEPLIKKKAPPQDSADVPPAEPAPKARLGKTIRETDSQ